MPFSITPRGRVLLGALVSLAVTTFPLRLAAQSAKPSTSSAPRGSGIPAGYSAVREADLRRDVGEMASPPMRGREGGTVDGSRLDLGSSRHR
jgi:hypothetical protein